VPEPLRARRVNRYAHALGQLARSGVGMLSRQTLLGGDYELINRTSGEPNPDYYVAVLWHDLIGSEVLDVMMVSNTHLPN
jgi:heparanase 1